MLTHYGESEVAGELIGGAIGGCNTRTEAGMVIAGYSHLAGAINDARKLSCSGAMEHITAASEFAARTGETDLYMTSFGPLNVQFHRHAIELESGDPHRAAIEGAQPSIPASHSALNRAGHHWQDNARAWLLSGKPDRALAALNKARAAAPQQTRLHPSVRETLNGIAAAEKRRPRLSLGGAKPPGGYSEVLLVGVGIGTL
ncbi:hypothetical protein ACFXG4_33020 [Nocardia sp. NPDC059246]|uniref:hypothetical protein n=1 Tax=unclassified Nocardia TaxID=2637762 RepID=UPI0036AE14F6